MLVFEPGFPYSFCLHIEREFDSERFTVLYFSSRPLRRLTGSFFFLRCTITMLFSPRPRIDSSFQGDT
jgi:hypothetical protein